MGSNVNTGDESGDQKRLLGGRKEWHQELCFRYANKRYPSNVQ